ncbi:MAG: response regulator transcription factor [Chloroflexi bacterium]|nr:response regulator transcription factor [Chloroflexota bacterium]
MKVLIIEDDPAIVDTVSLIFEISWPDAKTVSSHSGIESIELASKESPDLVILDLGLPDTDGIDVLRRIRQLSDVPLVVLTARTDQGAIARGLDSGADDYITKPFDPVVFVSRVKSVLRRSHTADIGESGRPVVCGSLVIDLAKRDVTLRGNRIKLTSMEWGLLNYLIQNEGRVVPFKELWENVWGSEFIEDVSALRTCVWRLRAKLGDDDNSSCVIESYRSTGYRFVKPL